MMKKEFIFTTETIDNLKKEYNLWCKKKNKKVKGYITCWHISHLWEFIEEKLNKQSHN